VKNKFSRKQLLAYSEPATVSVRDGSMSGAHFIGAALRSQGRDVRLIPAQFVKPFVKSNKNDFIDAEAIAEAVVRRTCLADQDRRSTGSAGTTPDARPFGASAHCGDQPDPRISARAGHHLRSWPREASKSDGDDPGRCG
jgi:hypothetical protein